MDPNPHNWQCSSSQLQQPSPPLPAVKPFDMRELLASLPNTMPLGEGSTHDHQHQLSGLTRNQQKRRHKTEAPSPYRRIRISSGTITSDRSTGAQPVYARMGAFDDTGAGEVGPPSGNPQMVNHKSINRRQIQANYRRRQRVKERHDIYGSGLSQTQRGKEDPSVYKIPVLDFQTGATAGHLNIPAIISAPAPSFGSRSAEMSDKDMATNAETGFTEMGKQPVKKGYYELRRAGLRQHQRSRQVRFAGEDAAAT